jgi:hypothetical protein
MNNPAPDATLQTVLDELPRCRGLTPKAMSDIVSAIYVFSRALERRPGDIPGRIDVVERLGRDLNATRLGITQGRLANVRSMVRRSLKLTGHGNVSRRLDLPLDPTWKALAGLFDDPRTRMMLRRLFRILQLRGIKPEAVSPSAFALVRDYLHQTGIARVDATYREFVLAWNRLQDLLRPYRT